MFLAGHVPHCLKPYPKRLPGTFEDRSGRWRGLTLACRTPGLASGRSPCRLSAADRALKPIRPPNPFQVLDASRLGREPRIEFLQRARVIHAAHGMSSLFFQHPSILHLVPTRGKWIALLRNMLVRSFNTPLISMSGVRGEVIREHVMHRHHKLWEKTRDRLSRRERSPLRNSCPFIRGISAACSLIFCRSLPA